MWTSLELQSRHAPHVPRTELEGISGDLRQWPVNRWLAAATPFERSLLRLTDAPVLDIGCGPGRHVAALRDSGVEVLGIDRCSTVVAHARARGLPVTRCDVFGPVPQPGCWRGALLMDGSVGIGGDPERLLRRCQRLLAPGGSLLVEVDRHGVGLRSGLHRILGSATPDRWFLWAHVGVDAIAALADDTGWSVADIMSGPCPGPGVHAPEATRWFALLSR